MATRGERAGDIVFLVPGQPQPDAARDPGAPGTVKRAVRVATTRGAADAPQRLVARPGDDVVVLTIADGPTLVLHPEDARDLMLAQAADPGADGTPARGAATTRAGRSPTGPVTVPAQLAWPTRGADATTRAARGPLGQAILGGIQVITGLFKDPAAKLVAAEVTKKVDGQVVPGVYALRPERLEPLKGTGTPLAAVPPAANGGATLVLLHGTFVDTAATFRKLWDHPDAVRTLFDAYAGQVYALDHPTLGTSPIGNALALANALPAGARLHLVTHSRGGLVAEVLARACAGRPLDPGELRLFDGEGYAQHRTDLAALFQVAQARSLRVERVVRIACPARGTTLASQRLDAYLSVLNWGLQLAGVPVAPQLLGFLHEVARRRADPAELPGLEAMMPGSPLVQWLNTADEPLPGELRVIAGDMQGDSVGSWVKTLLSDAFYWTDNDLVVQTRSMYGGAPRAATFLLDRGAQVSHFNYFANARTVQALVGALTLDQPADFAPIGPLSWAGEDASGTRAARAVARSRGGDAKAAAQRPAVFVLPGILGSNLKLDGKRLWLGVRFVNGLKKLAWDPAQAARVEPDGPIGMVYDDLIERLADTHEVIPFAFDWRRPIEDEARRLAAAVDAALTARETSRQPVRLIAHSMGGLVARTMRLEKPDTWQRMMARDGARLLMLGTPNGGSWAPMQVMSGDDTFGNALVAFGALFDNGGARRMMAGMPGFLQLQASLLDPSLRLDRAETWAELAAKDIEQLRSVSFWHRLEGPQRTVYEWGAPPQAVLDQAVALRRRLDAQAAALDADARRMLLVVGHAPFTPDGYVLAENGLEYLDTPDGGDGRVPLHSALLPGVSTWTLDAEHGKLPDVSEAFAAYIELLTNGDTTLLPRLAGTRAAVEAKATVVRSRPSRGVGTFVPPSTGADVLGAAPQAAAAGRTGRAGTPLQVRVLNADLKFVREPLLLGHYRSLVLTGTEKVVDSLVGQAMSRSLAVGLYPEAPGTFQVFGNERTDPDNVFDMARPSAAIVAGLGEEGKLRAVDLLYTVRQAIVAYAQRVAERSGGRDATFELAATLLGSGGMNITAGTAAQLIVQGALDANAKLEEGGFPRLCAITLVELYLERAADAWRAVQLQEDTAPNRLHVEGRVHSGTGALRRSLDSSYRGSSYDMISALTVEHRIAYTLDTKRSRTEVRAQQAQGTLLRELVRKASNDANQDTRIGHTLFNLLVPVEMEPFLGGSGELLIELDDGTAGIPWELLDTQPDPNASDTRPWAIRSKLLRKLRVEQFREHVHDASTEDSVLVIGEPACDATRYPPLPGARAEALAVARRIAMPDVGIDADRVTLLAGGDDAQAVINALFERAYRIVHIAGHGEPLANGGVVLSGEDTYLGANEVRAMRVVPELVFLNCCHLAGREAGTVLAPYDRAAFAANMAEELIRVGVRCVIAAGWAVEDGPAEEFATTFYAELLNGARYIEAVAAARSAAWKANPRGNTWAAYQCYGDPDWCWQRTPGDAQRPPTPPGERFAAIASPVSLALALENIAIGASYSRADRGSPAQRDSLRYLEAEFGNGWGGMGAVAEAFGVAYAEVGDTDKAIEWYTAALAAPDASASFKAAEQLGNQLVRRGGRARDAARGIVDVQAGIAQLESIAALQPTVERGALLGSAYKRLTMLQHDAGRAVPAAQALARALEHYTRAAELARSRGGIDLYFPAKNVISCALREALLEGRLPTLAPAQIHEVRQSLRESAQADPNFWTSVGQTELVALEAIAAGRLAAEAAVVEEQLADLKARVPSRSRWDSVHAEARFTLEPYRAMHPAGSAEARAADELLAALKAMSDG